MPEQHVPKPQALPLADVLQDEQYNLRRYLEDGALPLGFAPARTPQQAAARMDATISGLVQPPTA
ncbi:hypothetical protein SPI_07987 [Niveomyces insectorum RCEF 264]|uniref:Uncharacterized protein n=1 Tax=Niveomyces insectorum RCEF 264 TaxID=1081102 RepID=A0A162MGI2_9HYPO|nr:hypothetical protein SPI_07987 [Niveomyces insectorum RCEF 264]